MIISIIGSQSSGKSTLLNHLFRTNFAVMDSKKARKQTTKGMHKRNKGLFLFYTGIWLGKDENEPYLIMDVEGTDSISNWGEKFLFLFFDA